MGTNYYLRKEVLPAGSPEPMVNEIGRFVAIHIGKSSMGNPIALNGRLFTSELDTDSRELVATRVLALLRKLFDDAIAMGWELVDEYDERVAPAELLEMFRSRKETFGYFNLIYVDFC